MDPLQKYGFYTWNRLIKRQQNSPLETFSKNTWCRFPKNIHFKVRRMCHYFVSLWFSFEKTSPNERANSGIANQVTMHFIEMVLVGANKLFWSNSNVILTRRIQLPRVPGLLIRNSAGISNHLVPRGTKMSAIDATLQRQQRQSLSVCIWFQDWAHLGLESTVPMHL